MRVQEELACLVVTGDALKKGESIADAVGGSGGELRWVEEWVDGNDFLEEGRHDTYQGSSVMQPNM